MPDKMAIHEIVGRSSGKKTLYKYYCFLFVFRVFYFEAGNYDEFWKIRAG
jgi:hypothetical protein